MENEAKLDLMLKKVTETESKLVDLEKSSRADMMSLKMAVGSWRPELEKKVNDLASIIYTLQLQMDQLQVLSREELMADPASQLGARDAAETRAEVFGIQSQSPPRPMEEAMLGTRRMEVYVPMKPNFKNTAPIPLPVIPVRPAVNEEKKTPEAASNTSERTDYQH